MKLKKYVFVFSSKILDIDPAISISGKRYNVCASQGDHEQKENHPITAVSYSDI
jgi:hypothetical protein